MNKNAVETLKKQLESPDTAIATKNPDARLFVAQLLEAITTREQPRNEPIRASEKLLLNLKDCQLLTGLSRLTIRDAIDSGNLKARIIGRGYKIKRRDLDQFVSNL